MRGLGHSSSSADTDIRWSYYCCLLHMADQANALPTLYFILYDLYASTFCLCRYNIRLAVLDTSRVRR